jgi:hypothetical protein
MELEFINFIFELENNTDKIIKFKTFESEDKCKVDYLANIKDIRPGEKFVIKFNIRTNKELEGEIIFDKTSFIIKNYLQSNSKKSQFALYEYESKYNIEFNYIMKYQPKPSLLQFSKISINLFDKNSNH